MTTGAVYLGSPTWYHLYRAGGIQLVGDYQTSDTVERPGLGIFENHHREDTFYAAPTGSSQNISLIIMR